ncbi:MAG: twin-arginine translocation signal domain-containing protein, partial [Alphaproteobacteria bacterium]|nr:twin-arginine translocation signal domain-containing protein [Alphaproteobacteria bacterium]
MKISRRQFLQVVGVGTLCVGLMPRIAFASTNSLKNVRTGLQPGDKTRLVIETSGRPSYALSYKPNQLIVNLSNVAGNSSVKTNLASGTLINRITQIQDGSTLQIVATLTSKIDAIQKNQILILEPNGDNDYRLVIDFVAGTGKGIDNIQSATTTATQSTTTSTNKHIIVIDAGHGG